jgi:hypothetical protein
MRNERWAAVQSVFNRATALSGTNRTAFLECACGPDVELLHEVTRLLEAAARSASGRFIDAAIAAEARRLLRDAPMRPAPHDADRAPPEDAPGAC